MIKLCTALSRWCCGTIGCTGQRTLKRRQTAALADTTRGIFFTLGLECSPCFEGVCLHERWSKLSTSPTRIHCCCNYSNAICHCKSSDYSAEWLLMKPSSDSFPAQRWWEDIDELRWLLRLRGKLHQGFTANPSRASQKLLPWIYHVRCRVPNCSEKLVCNHSRCLQTCWEEINLFNLNSR